MTIHSLRVEYLENPLGIDEKEPRLTWKLDSAEPGQKQTAYQVLVASSPRVLASDEGDRWDSGMVASDETVNIVYQGETLTARKQCFWKARVWDKDGNPSAWSAPGHWSMGLEDWTADWVSYRDQTPVHSGADKLYLPAARYFRKSWKANGSIRRATAYATALGNYELHVNGRRLGDAYFQPGWSDYAGRVYYNTFDVTDAVRSGENVVGAILTDGWYAGYVGFGRLRGGYGTNKSGRYFYGKTPALRVQLEFEYVNGKSEVISSDASWKVSTGPILEADMQMGEAYDARLEMPGWDSPGFDDSKWESAIDPAENGSFDVTFTDATGTRANKLEFAAPRIIQAYTGPPVRPVQELKPVELTEPKPGVFIYDLGQNFAGVVRLNVKGEEGTRVQLRFGEMLHQDGTLMTENLRGARATDTYILRGDSGGEEWTPRFTYHGFRYVELTGLPESPGEDAITGVVIHSDTPLTSSFECSDEMVNKLFHNVVWTQRSNFVELPTDCPQRDERLGWTGDAQVYVRTATFNADTAAFYTKWFDDLEESQLESGAYPSYAPSPYAGRPEIWGTAWADAGVICPHTFHTAYGDTRVLERHYDSMKRFIEFREENDPGRTGSSNGAPWGDWLALGGQTPIPYIDINYFAYSTSLMAEIADALGRADDAAGYRKLFDEIREGYLKTHVNEDGSLKVDTQTAYALALQSGILPEDRRQAAADRLAEKIRDNGNRMGTGFLGTRPLLPVLSAHGHHDLAAALLQSREFPSWGYEVVNGATTIWERWNSYTIDEGFGDAGMNSFSHYAFGAVAEWMFRSLAGIDTDGPGYKRIVFRPGPPTPGSNPDNEPVNRVKAEYDSIRGKIATTWSREGDRFEITVTVPPNTTGVVHLPSKDGVQTVEVDSGTHSFESEL